MPCGLSLACGCCSGISLIWDFPPNQYFFLRLHIYLIPCKQNLSWYPDQNQQRFCDFNRHPQCQTIPKLAIDATLWSQLWKLQSLCNVWSNQWRWSVPPLHCLIIKRYEWAFNRYRHHHQKQVHPLCVFRFQTSKQDRTTHTNRQEGQGQRLTTTSITNSGRRRRMQCISPNMHQLFACGYLLSLWIPPVTDLCTHLILECTFYILLCNVRLTYIQLNSIQNYSGKVKYKCFWASFLSCRSWSCFRLFFGIIWDAW